MTSAFQSLCYHYIRQESDDPLPRIFGTKINNFIDHVKMIQKKYNIISLDEIDSIYKNKNQLTNEKMGYFLHLMMVWRINLRLQRFYVKMAYQAFFLSLHAR